MTTQTGMHNLDWDVLGHPPNRDTITECESTGPLLPTSLTCEQKQAYLVLCPANCGCKNSMPRLAKKSRCQGLWTTKWKCRAYLEHVHRRRGNRRSQRDGDNMGTRQRSRVRTYHNTTKCDRQSSTNAASDYPDSEMDDWDWDEMGASPFKETTT